VVTTVTRSHRSPKLDPQNPPAARQAAPTALSPLAARRRGGRIMKRLYMGTYRVRAGLSEEDGRNLTKKFAEIGAGPSVIA
jgi:hypothetical protein